MSIKDITVVITSFRSENKILRCIKSLGTELSIIVVENSNDQALKEKLERDYSNIKCILSDNNLGYAKGNNLGLSMVKTKYALIINPDAEVNSHSIKNFFITVEKTKFSIIAPYIQESDNEETHKEEDQSVGG